jgi:hypothetical protein
MSRVYEIMKQTKKMPLDELALRSSLPAALVIQEVKMLAEDGLIQLMGELPLPANLTERGGDVIVMLSPKGISANTA